jgi:hypothetical protein
LLFIFANDIAAVINTDAAWYFFIESLQLADTH